ncbi:Rgp1-domain-containing protein [Mycena rebaudengoi]|nr:Rgp1-domain-containing protein [Mycena rebaudengoi]
MADVEVDPTVRIVVTPTQSSYFAGEPFSVTITFTNTRSPAPGPSRITPLTHKRGAHSISSAPIARPPTSPGTPRTPVQPLPRPPRDDRPGRKGLIGRTAVSSPPIPANTGSLPALAELRRKKLLAKSLSVSIAPPDLEVLVRGTQTPRSASVVPDSGSPLSPQLPTSLSRRSDTLPLASTHPHARKHSVFEGPQLQLQEIISSPISASTNGTLPSPYTPSASSSTFSLALDPIAESTAYPYPPKSALPTSPSHGHSVSISTTPTARTIPRRASQSSAQPYVQSQSQLGLGHPGPVPPRSAFSATFAPPNTELLLYAYASLTGRAVLAPFTGAGTPALGALRAALLRPGPGRARGGGSLSLQAAGGVVPRHRRSGSFSAGLRALGAGIGIWGRTPSGGEADERTAEGWAESDPETPLPTLEVPPEMLAVDLTLGPGESRSYVYTFLLPANLPPTFKGRTLRFSYELVVGACRAAGTSSSVSRVMKVPIRVYNNVVVGRPARPYDLMWPVARRIATPVTTPTSPHPPALSADPKPFVQERHGSQLMSTTAHPPETQSSGSVAELERYATRLLAASSSPSASDFPWGVGEESLGAGGEGSGGGLSGCREAVEVLTRNLKKVSYDITKDGVTVAVLTFPKSAFRLGETVNGVVEVNWREGRGRVLQLTALLEAHESLPTTLATPPSTPATGRYLRRVHAEHHARFALGTLRLGFALDIPSDGSPAFGVVSSPPFAPGMESGNLDAGGLEWKVRICLLVGVARAESDAGTEGVRAKGLVRDVDDADEGGRGAWGSAWRAPGTLGVLERTPPPPLPTAPARQQEEKSSGWGAFLTASFLGSREEEYHDGDDLYDDDGTNGGATVEEDSYGYDGVKSDFAGGVGVGVRYGGREDGWGEIKAEMVECVVPVKVLAGNTAFRASDVVFDV